MRTLVGKTDPKNADPGTIRFDYAQDGRKNIIHASDSPESVAREIKVIFKDDELVEW
jgi:nucleoside-diphosphate kinase